MNRGLDRQVVFHTTDDRLDFGRLIEAAHERCGVTVLAYCLMDNHFHLVVSCPDGGLSPFMQDVSAKFTRHNNERHGGDGPVFRGRFASRPIRDERYLVNAVRYVHRNPLDLGPSCDLAAYRWSSHRTYLGLRRAPDWLSVSPVLEWFDGPSAFDTFVRAAPPATVVGSASAADLVGALEMAVSRHADGLDRSTRGVVRTCAYLLLRRLEPRSADALVRWLGPSSEDALHQARLRAERHARSEPHYERVVADAIALVSRCV
ncbi:MAG: transposase [Ilumatobacter sp.]|uniref:transposase n=1 Tax=Ilumatobacter sp. TaxID=1967498 RepID=UPI002608A095|nr:transposase [Ilumatobacter sp.]MDJ0769316.1 transposase [Ilumatobacter sp.]